jgi:hypothetical protein
MAMSDTSDWLHLGQAILGPLLQTASEGLRHYAVTDLHVAQIPSLALYHLGSCLDVSGTANEEGHHAVAISLTRQSIEALTIIELGFLEPTYSEPLLSGWIHGQRSHGKLRRELEKTIWPGYGTGLWDETWAEYFSNLARAVQPYAHYSHELLQWQLTSIKHLDNQRFIAVVGPGTIDPVKGLRVTLLHVLVTWTLGRILFENSPDIKGLVRREHVAQLGQALARSELLVERADWWIQMWPHTFFK